MTQLVILAGSPSATAFSNTIITDDYYRRDFELMIGLLDATGTLLANPEILFSGFMDKADLVLTDAAGKIQLVCESRATNLQRASDLRFTDEDLQVEFSGDLMGEYIYRMLDLKLYWGDREVGGWSTGRGRPSGGAGSEGPASRGR